MRQLRGGLGRTYLQQRDFANAEKELKSGDSTGRAKI